MIKLGRPTSLKIPVTRTIILEHDDDKAILALGKRSEVIRELIKIHFHHFDIIGENIRLKKENKALKAENIKNKPEQKKRIDILERLRRR